MKYFPIMLILVLQFSVSHGQVVMSNDSAANKKPEGIWTLDWRFDGDLFAIGGDDKVLRIYKADNMQLFKAYRFTAMIRHVSWHPGNKSILAVTTGGHQNGILNIDNNAFIPLDIPDGARAVDWNFDGRLLATADNVGLIKIWNAEGNLLRVIKKQDENSYFSLDWHPAKNLLVASGDDIRIVDTAGTTLKVIKHRTTNTGVLAVRWHPSGDFFVTGDYGQVQEGIATLLQFWKADGTLIKTVKGSKGEIRNLEWDAAGKYLATASDRLRIWNRKGKLLYEGKKDDSLWGVDWNRKTNRILTAAFSGSILLWSKEGKLLQVVNTKENKN
jgi:WD40 repeat protein